MKEIELKSWIGPFGQVIAGLKRFELRRHDRDFQVGDTILLREWNQTLSKYTGRTCSVGILQISTSEELRVFSPSMPANFCLMSIDPRLAKLYDFDIQFVGGRPE